MARGYARTFGQDLMRGEHVVGGGKVSDRRNNRANAQPSGGGGGWKAMNEQMAANRAKRQRGLALGTQDWVQSKIAEGDIEGGMSANQSGTSIFDPVLCELAYRWFCPTGGLVLDPFAGGSVRGIVASKLGRRYVGIDLRPEQIEANREQAVRICQDPQPVWHEGDSLALIGSVDLDGEADFLFSCPPYADLEVYSDDPRDLSTMEYFAFRETYRRIIALAAERLKQDRFACFVVGDVRDKKGLYRNFPGHTVEAFEQAGLRLYNEAILVTAAGSLPIRAGKQFASTRKLGKTHQNVLVFVKGDPRKAADAVGEVEFGEIEDVAPPAFELIKGSDLAGQFGEIL